jgi:hypothetical protein
MISTHSANSLIPTDTGHASKNEMDFSTMLSIPCYYDMFTIDASDPSAENKYSVEVSPAKGPDVTNADTPKTAELPGENHTLTLRE